MKCFCRSLLIASSKYNNHLSFITKSAHHPADAFQSIDITAQIKNSYRNYSDIDKEHESKKI